MRAKSWFQRKRRSKKEAKKLSLEILRLIEEEDRYCTEIAQICQISYSNAYSYIKRLEATGAL
jgi:predicted transcriptional regulator